METIDITGLQGGGGQPVKQAPAAIYRNVILSLTQNLSMLITTDSGSGAGVTKAVKLQILLSVTLNLIQGLLR